MAAICPKCNTGVPDFAFGIYACSNCKTVLSIDFDGNVTFADDSGDMNPQHIKEDTVTRSIDLSKVAPPKDSDFEIVTSGGQKSPSPTESATFAPQGDSPGILQPEVDGFLNPSEPDLNLVPEPEAPPKPLPGSDLPPYGLPQLKAEKASTKFDDIVAFGNSELSQGNEGHYLYDVLINGIDSEDLRAAVAEALEDSRFGWGKDDFLSKMRGGSILLSRINAVKASVLVGRLKGFPLEISWQQVGIFEVDTNA